MEMPLLLLLILMFLQNGKAFVGKSTLISTLFESVQIV